MNVLGYKSMRNQQCPLIKYLIKEPLAILLFSVSFTFSQNQSFNERIDSLSNLSYEELKENISRKDTVKSLVFVKAYLERAKHKKDTLKQINVYKALLKYYDKKNFMQYADSILRLTENNSFPEKRSLIFYLKGIELYNKSKYIEALDCFINAKKLTKKDTSDIELSIGLIKSILGDYDEASYSFKKALTYYEKEKYDSGLIVTYFALGDAYRFLRKLDSSMYYNQLGKKLAIELNNKEYENYFKLNIGATLSDSKDLELSQANLISALPEIIKMGDKPNMEMCHFFLGRNYSNLNKQTKALYHLKKMDSIFLETKDIHPELRQGYAILIDYYKSKSDLNSQLTYVNRMLMVDSVLRKNNKALSEKIEKDNQYNNDKLLLKKEQIISKMTSSKNNYLILLIFVLIIIVLLLYKNFKHRQDKIKFKKLIDNYQSNDAKSEKEIKVISPLNIKKDIVEDIMTKLEEFEENKDFTNSEISRIGLAKAFNTNPKYLSNVINHIKEKTFIDYIKQLRIEYAIERMKNDDNFLNLYSIKGIAKEVGFKSSESFSKAFYANTGIKPSYFIKELKKKS